MGSQIQRRSSLMVGSQKLAALAGGQNKSGSKKTCKPSPKSSKATRART